MGNYTDTAGSLSCYKQVRTYAEYTDWKIIFTIIFGYTAIRGIMKVDFMQITMSLGILGWVYDDVLGIEAITPWIILISAFLLGLGLNLIFKRKSMHIDISYDSNNPNHKYMELKSEKGSIFANL